MINVYGKTGLPSMDVGLQTAGKAFAPATSPAYAPSPFATPYVAPIKVPVKATASIFQLPLMQITPAAPPISPLKMPAPLPQKKLAPAQTFAIMPTKQVATPTPAIAIFGKKGGSMHQGPAGGYVTTSSPYTAKSLPQGVAQLTSFKTGAGVPTAPIPVWNQGVLPTGMKGSGSAMPLTILPTMTPVPSAPKSPAQAQVLTTPGAAGVSSLPGVSASEIAADIAKNGAAATNGVNGETDYTTTAMYAVGGLFALYLLSKAV